MFRDVSQLCNDRWQLHTIATKFNQRVPSASAHHGGAQWKMETRAQDGAGELARLAWYYGTRAAGTAEGKGGMKLPDTSVGPLEARG